MSIERQGVLPDEPADALRRSRTLRERALEALSKSRLLHLMQRVTGRTCVVLLYHSVALGVANPYLNPAQFAQQIDLLGDEFRFISADEYLWHRVRKRRPPRRSLLLTFDDGYVNNATYVQPLLAKRRIPWILFSVTAGIDRPGSLLWFTQTRAAALFSRQAELTLLGRTFPLPPDVAGRHRVADRISSWVRRHPAKVWQPAVNAFLDRYRGEIPGDYLEAFGRLMNQEELRALAADPLVEIGAHTATHPYLTTVDDAALTEEVVHSSRRLADALGRRVRLFAYPAGDYGRRELAAVRAAGFDAAMAVRPMVGETHEFEIERFGIFDASVTMARAKALGLGYWLRALRIGSV